MDTTNQFKAVPFLKSLYKGCSGYLNIRILTERKNIFVPLSQIGSMIPKIKKTNKGKDIYFAVATRKNGDGTKEGIIEIPDLYSDLDFNGRRSQDVWNELMKFPLRPTAVVESGGGYQPHWLLKTPATRDQIAKIESILKRLASYLGGDMECTDASRIMRLPGSVNLKPERNGHRARLIIFKPNRRYELSDFDFLPPIGENQKINNDALPWHDRVIADGVREGERNSTMAKLAGRYVGMGLSRTEAMAILAKANASFNPPLDEREAEKILDSIIRTDSRNSGGTDKTFRPQRGEGRGLHEILAAPVELPDYLIKPILQAGDKGFSVASYKVGKTLLAMQMTLCLSYGIPFLGFPVPKPRKVLFVRFELPWRRFNQGLRMMNMGLTPFGPCQVEPVFELATGFNVLERDFDWLIRMIDKHEPALLILDPLYKMTDLDLRDTSSAMPLIRAFEAVRGRYKDVCILINAHQIKNANNDKNWDTSYGPMVFYADMDFEIRLRVYNRDTEKEYFMLDHICNDENIKPMRLRRDYNTLLYFPDHSVKEKKQSKDTDEFEKVRQSLTAFIDKNGRKPNQTEFRKMIKDELGKSDPKAREIIENGQDKYWKELSEGKGKATLYEPILDNSAQTLES